MQSSAGSASNEVSSEHRLEPQDSGWWSRTRSKHHQRHHAERTIRTALARAGLSCHATYGSHVTGVIETPLDDLHHAKAVYIARHAAPREQ